MSTSSVSTSSVYPPWPSDLAVVDGRRCVFGDGGCSCVSSSGGCFKSLSESFPFVASGFELPVDSTGGDRCCAPAAVSPPGALCVGVVAAPPGMRVRCATPSARGVLAGVDCAVPPVGVLAAEVGTNGECVSSRDRRRVVILARNSLTLPHIEQRRASVSQSNSSARARTIAPGPTPMRRCPGQAHAHGVE